MKRLLKKSMFILIFMFVFSGLLLFMSSAQAKDKSAQAQDGVDPYGVVATPDDVLNPQDSEDVSEFVWTQEAMQNAIPMELLIEEDPRALDFDSASLPMDAPVFSPGWEPGSGPQPDSTALMELDSDADLQTSPPFSPPSNPVDYYNYAPFQRMNFPGAYMRYPRSTVGRLFFQQDHDGNGTYSSFSCSASVINRSVIATAGHCVHNGLNGQGANGGWSRYMWFYPSYDNGVNPARGGWFVGYKATSGTWGSVGGVDRDYACGVTAATGSVCNKRVGDVTGWTGAAFNSPTRQSIVTWGYPAGSPFTGAKIVNTWSTEWYQVDMTSGDGNVSKYIGSDQTGGCSGGPWWLNYTHPALNYPDTDGSNYTNPGQSTSNVPFINGVNSHRRCKVNCNTPPSASAGAYCQEMGSPQFTWSNSDNQDVHDVFDACAAHQP
jgi:V8-like Glu-specific endopeptidase